MESCICDKTLLNSGSPICEPLMKYARKQYLVPKYGSNGEENFIDLSVTIDAAFLTEKLNAADPLDRWYPVGPIKEANSTRAEAIYQEFPLDRSKARVGDGIRTQTYQLATGNSNNPKYLKFLESWQCIEFGEYIIEADGKLAGSLREAGKLFPILIDNNTWSPVFVYPTGTTLPIIQVTFDIDLSEQDSNLNYILASEMVGANFLSAKGLLDIFPTFSAISQTGFTVKLSEFYGSALNPETVTGLVAADFVSSVGGATSKIRNTTTNADVAITSVTYDSVAKTYTFAFVSQTVGNKLVLKPKKNGFDFSAVEASVITVV